METGGHRERGQDKVATAPLNGNGHRRRTVRAQVLAEETHCALCGGEVDKTLSFQWGQHGPRCTDPSCPGCAPHPMRAEVDEIVPRAKGGSQYVRSNCQLTHRKCNSIKGDGTRRTPTKRVSLPTSRRW